MKNQANDGEHGQGLRAACRWLGWLVLSLLLLAVMAWRLGCVRVGPDPDTDAYGHYLIARVFWDTPLNFEVHWVWLPLYHALLALPVRLGATLEHVRFANAVLAALPPLLVYWAMTGSGVRALMPGQDGGSRALAPGQLRPEPWVAASIVALDPLGMQMGTTGQMEIVFCILLVLAAGLLARERFGWAAAVLGLLVLTRYEGWAVAACVGALLLYRRVFHGTPLGRAGLACLLLPACCVFGWAALRHSGGGSWFGFLFENQAFAERVLERAPAAHGVFGALARYTLGVPYRVLGVAALLAPLGIRRCLRQHGVWLVAPGLAIVGFLTSSSLSRSQLGLDRHFLSVVPFVAIWMARGIAACSEALAPWLRRRAWSAGLSRGTFPLYAALAGLVLFGAGWRLVPNLRAWKDATRLALPEQHAVARFLQNTSPASLIVCADASIEVLSELDRRRFVRAPMNAQAVPWLAELAGTRDVYVVGRAFSIPGPLKAAPLGFGKLDGPPDAFVAVHLPAGSLNTLSLL